MVTYSVYTNNTCTALATTGSTGQINAQPPAVTVTNGVVPNSANVTFQQGGTYYWQAVYSGDANNARATSDCTSEILTVIGPCVLGYPDHSHDPQSSVVFNESEVLRAFGLFGSGTSLHVALFYNDEHALTLGVNPGVTLMGTTDANHATHASSPSLGDLAATDPSGRPIFPALFATDLTVNGVGSRVGDWQQGGRPVGSPSDIWGTWKAANRSSTGAITPGPDPAKNNWNLDGSNPDPVPLINGALPKNEGYGAEVAWNISSLGLVSGHAYRLEFMVHDGDQNKTGGDSGEACVNVFVP
jgi:hypothetical protein